MSFWANFGIGMTTSIDKLLSENPTLEQVLDDDDCIQELKSQNEKLIELFSFFRYASALSLSLFSRHFVRFFSFHTDNSSIYCLFSRTHPLSTIYSFIREDIISSLVSYVVDPPPDDADIKRKEKFYYF